MIFAIKRFETHDGDGIRTTVFFKGCPLRCVWCHNPESFSAKKEIAFNPELCTNCLTCTKLCTANTVENGKHAFNRKDCTLCTKCVDPCPARAFTLYGEERTSSDIAQELMRDKMFFDGSGGGVTLSGGEPLMQGEEILRLIERADVHTAIETSGYADSKLFDKVISKMDYVMFD